MNKLLKSCLRLWQYAVAFYAGGLVFYLIGNMQSMTWQQIFSGFFTLILVLHVFEEGTLPGGFFYMYNTATDPDNKLYDRYPINEKSETIENFLCIAVSSICFWVFPNNLTSALLLVLCTLEVPGHIISGVVSKKHLATKGKKTIYNPGLATTILGFLPLAVYGIMKMTENGILISQILGGIGLGIAMLLGCVLLPDRIFMSKESPYVFTHGYGYFNKFLKNKEN